MHWETKTFDLTSDATVYPRINFNWTHIAKSLFVFFPPPHPQPRTPFFLSKGKLQIKWDDERIFMSWWVNKSNTFTLIPFQQMADFFHVHTVSASHTEVGVGEQNWKTRAQHVCFHFILIRLGACIFLIKPLFPEYTQMTVPWSTNLVAHTIASQKQHLRSITSCQNRPAVQSFDRPIHPQPHPTPCPQLDSHKNGKSSARALAANNLAPCDSEDVLCRKRKQKGFSHWLGSITQEAGPQNCSANLWHLVELDLHPCLVSPYTFSTSPNFGGSHYPPSSRSTRKGFSLPHNIHSSFHHIASFNTFWARLSPFHPPPPPPAFSIELHRNTSSHDPLPRYLSSIPYHLPEKDLKTLNSRPWSTPTRIIYISSSRMKQSIFRFPPPSTKKTKNFSRFLSSSNSQPFSRDQSKRRNAFSGNNQQKHALDCTSSG